MTSLLTALNSFSFTGQGTSPGASTRTGTSRGTTTETSEMEFQSVFAASAVLLAGGIAASLVALAQVF